MIKWALSLFLVMSLPLFAQTTTTYTVTSDNGGVYSTPFRAFNIPLDQNSTVSWLEVGAHTACYGQTVPTVGFIFITLKGVAQPCIPLVGSPANNVGEFAGVDANGNPISGSYNLTITTKYGCSGGRGGCHTSFLIKAGSTFTVTD